MKSIPAIKFLSFQQSLASIGLVVSSLVAANAPAHAAAFTASDADPVCFGRTTCTVNNFFTLTAQKNGDANPQITHKAVGGVLGLGVAKDAKNPASDQSYGEIDSDESLSVGFKSVQQVTALDLSFLYQPGVYGDQVYEMALATPLGSALKGLLTVTGNTTATWTFNGNTSTASVKNLSPSVEGDAGEYEISNPFGNMLVSGFSLTPNLNTIPGTNTIAKGAANSDFALAGVKTATSVPEPGAAGAVLGVGAMAGLRLRRRRVA